MKAHTQLSLASIAALCGILIGCRTTNAVDKFYSPESYLHMYWIIDNDELWLTVSESSAIVVGRAEITSANTEKLLHAMPNEYVEIPIKVSAVLSGVIPAKPLTLRLHAGGGRRTTLLNEKIAGLLLSEKHESIFFLQNPVATENAISQSEYYLSSNCRPTIFIATKEALEWTKEQIALQDKILEDFNVDTLSDKISNYQEVSAWLEDLISEIKSKKDGAIVFNREWIGFEKAPALILLMDDRRDLPETTIGFFNAKESFEPFQRHSPKQVCDLIEALLCYSVGFSRMHIESGGSDEARQFVIDGYRVFLHYWMTDMQKTGKVRRPVLRARSD